MLAMGSGMGTAVAPTAATRQLRDEHEGILVVLAVLERLAGDLQAGRDVDRTHLAQILDFLRTFADKCHHGKEEDLLFPALAAAGLPVQGGPIGVMLYEHTVGRDHIRRMGEALEAMNAGENAWDAFASNAIGYVNLLREHIEKENQVLFVIAEQRLGAGEHERLAREFDRVEAERIGPGVHERYHAMIDDLRKAYL